METPVGVDNQLHSNWLKSLFRSSNLGQNIDIFSLIRRGSRSYFRQNQENNKDTRVRPPQEFFEPTDLPEIPQNLQPEIFYILHNLKYV